MNVKAKKRRFYICLTVSILCAILFFYLLFNVIANQDSYMPYPSDAIVVLGHSIESETDSPSQWLTERLNTALELYNQGYGTKLIVTGGKGPRDNITVSESMANWLMEKGIEEEDILIETRAKNTGQNFSYSKEIAEENNIESIVVVTNDFHMYRSIMIANDYFDYVSGCEAKLDMSVRKFFAYLKEPLSIIKYKLTSFVFD